LFLEGPRLIEEALRSSLKLKTLVLTPAFKNPELAKRAQAASQRTVSMSESVFDAISDVEEPQGILAIVERTTWSWEQIVAKSPAPIVILDGIQNPGNVAGIVRTAEAAGVAGVITTPTTARLNSPKALRGAMGSVLRVPTMEHLKPGDIAGPLKEAGYALYATAADSELQLYTEVDWTKPVAIILGQEGSGLSQEWEPHAFEGVKIPMDGPVDSLNVAAAAAILLYEAYRQRHQRRGT
jgi:TrmH family RNA methyltransferase